MSGNKFLLSSLVVISLGSNIVFSESTDSQMICDSESTEVSGININESETLSTENIQESKNSEQTNVVEENNEGLKHEKTENNKLKEEKILSSRSVGDIWTSPKYESTVESALVETTTKEMGNKIRKKLKEIPFDTKLGYLKGDTIDIDLETNSNEYIAKNTLVQTYKDFPPSIGSLPSDWVLSIGAGYKEGTVSFPVGSIGYSTDGTIKYTLITSQKLRIERIRNKPIIAEEKLLMEVPISYNGFFYYESAEEGILNSTIQWVAFKNREEHRYVHSFSNKKIKLNYDRLEENWQWAKGDIDILDHISLEDSPEVQATPKKSSFDMPTKEPSTPEEYVNTSNTMSGGTLTYTWIDQLDVNAKNDQSVRVKVVDQLDDYKHEATTTLKFKTNPDKTSVVVKDSSLYQGQTYNPETDNFVSATDVNGNPLKWDDSNLKVSGDTVDMKVPKIYNQTLTYTYSLNGETKTKTSNYKVEVKEDQTKLELKDVELYVGEKWDPNLPFKNVTDKDGKKLTADDIEWYYIDEKKKEKNIDMSKPGTHKVRLVYLDGTNKWKYGIASTVTVKEDKSSIKTKDVELYVGGNWTRKDNFISATDEDGKDVPWSDGRIDTNGAQVDTSKPNEYTFKYTFKGKVKHTDAMTKVTVKENVLSLVTPKDFSFGHAVLGKVKKLYWDKKSEVSIDNKGNRKWDLTTKLTGSSNQDFFNYLKFKDQSFKEGSVLIDSGASSKNITNELTEDKFIYVDYSSIKSIRKDKATLEWTLSPSTKGVEE